MKKLNMIKPDFFDRFSCKGAGCGYTCCQGWGITMSKDEYRKTRNLLEGQGLYGGLRVFKKLPPEQRSKYTEMAISLDENGFCPFLSEDKLCDLQCRFGPGILSNTCSVYPRDWNRYMDQVQCGMSLGCEKVLELLLENRGHISFSTQEEDASGLSFRTEISAAVFPKFPLLAYYPDIVSFCIMLLQAEDVSLEDRIVLLGMGLQKIEALSQDGRDGEIPNFISRYLNTLEQEDANTLIAGGKFNISVLMHNLILMKRSKTAEDRHYNELLNRINQRLDVKLVEKIEGGEVKQRVIFFSTEEYRCLQDQYARFMEGKEYFLENIMVAFLFYTNIPFYTPYGRTMWDNYIYFAWVYSIMKFTLTASMDDIRTDEDLISHCAILFRIWSHSSDFGTQIVKMFRENESDTLAHMVLLLKSC